MYKTIALCSLLFVVGCLDDAVETSGHIGTDAGSDVQVADQSGDSTITDPPFVCDAEIPLCCTSTVDCQDGVCDPNTHLCVECLNSPECTGLESYCLKPAAGDSSQNQCVQCINESHCTARDASKCEANSCVGCVVKKDCESAGSGLVCDDGLCVGCVTDADCSNDFACDVDAKTCSTTIKVGEQEDCYPCVGGSSCRPGLACVSMRFGSEAHGRFCMPRYDGSVCKPPFGFGVVDREISDGSHVSVCMIDEIRTTCEAVLEYGTPCSVEQPCEAPGALCRPRTDAVLNCTYECQANDQCEELSSCFTVAGLDYCRR